MMLRQLLNTFETSEERRVFRDVLGNSLAHLASKVFDLSILEELIEKDGIDVNARNTDGETALLMCARCGNYPGAEYLLEHKADPDIYSGAQDSPLLWAGYIGNVDIVKLLLKYGADPYHKYCDGRDLLMWSTLRRKILVVKFLLEELPAYQINHADTSDNTCLQLAIDEDTKEIIDEYRIANEISCVRWILKMKHPLTEFGLIPMIFKFYM
jgi:ankyrin repeat protein